MPFKPRWIATVTYRTNDGPLDVAHDIEEIADLHELIEAGPSWDTIIKIDIRRVNPIFPDLTVEVAAKL